MALMNCDECGKEVSDKAAACPHCGAPLNVVEAEPAPAVTPSKNSGQLSPPAILGLVGAGIMALGVFLPFAKAPIIGSINLFKNGGGDGVFILLLAALSALFLLIRRWLLAMVPAILSGCILILDVFDFHNKMGSARVDLNRQLSDNPFRGFAEGMLGSVSLDVGTFVVGLGVILCIAATIWGRNLEKSPG